MRISDGHRLAGSSWRPRCSWAEPSARVRLEQWNNLALQRHLRRGVIGIVDMFLDLPLRLQKLVTYRGKQTGRTHDFSDRRSLKGRSIPASGKANAPVFEDIWFP